MDFSKINKLENPSVSPNIPQGNSLTRCCPTRSSRTACGPPTDFTRPASDGKNC